MTDFRSLLSKYIAHVGGEEGISFLSEIDQQPDGTWVGYHSRIVFTAEEMDALNKCADEAPRA